MRSSGPLPDVAGRRPRFSITFAAFGLPVLVVSPLAGRFVDRRGGCDARHRLARCGDGRSALPGHPRVWWVVVLSLVEGTAFAMVSPTLFALVARATPAGRSSTAQGIFGAAGTLGTMRRLDVPQGRWPTSTCASRSLPRAWSPAGLVAGLLIGGRALQRVMPAPPGRRRRGRTGRAGWRRRCPPTRPSTVDGRAASWPPVGGIGAASGELLTLGGLTHPAAAGTLRVAGWSSGSSSGS